MSKFISLTLALLLFGLAVFGPGITAGSAKGSTVMGDMFVISAAVDYDLGHHADIREMEDSPEAADIFETAMKNNFTVGSAVIDAILAGNF